MKKKLVLVLLMATLFAGGAFAQVSMSAGLGGTFSYNTMIANWTSDGKDMLSGNPFLKAESFNMNMTGGGFFAYFDITYVMLSAGMGFYDVASASKDANNSKAKNILTTFDIGLLGKYPFAVGGGYFFPLLGVDVKIAVADDYIVDGEKVDLPGKVSASDMWTSLFFKFGIGGDIPLGDKLYLRPMFLYGFSTLPAEFKKMQDEANKDKKMFDLIYSGLDIKLAFGFKFN
jgi:hypothetical protein